MRARFQDLWPKKVKINEKKNQIDYLVVKFDFNVLKSGWTPISLFKVRLDEWFYHHSKSDRASPLLKIGSVTVIFIIPNRVGASPLSKIRIDAGRGDFIINHISIHRYVASPIVFYTPFKNKNIYSNFKLFKSPPL